MFNYDTVNRKFMEHSYWTINIRIFYPPSAFQQDILVIIAFFNGSSMLRMVWPETATFECLTSYCQTSVAMRFANLFGLTIINLFWIEFHYAYPSNSKNSNPTNFRRWLNLLNMDMSSSDKKLLANSIYDMFSFAYDSYLKYGFPYDELNPIDCVGRGYDHENPDNINVNDALGDYLLTLIDSLDTLAVSDIQLFT